MIKNKIRRPTKKHCFAHLAVKKQCIRVDCIEGLRYKSSAVADMLEPLLVKFSTELQNMTGALLHLTLATMKL